jgi:hypothetical protein
MANVTARSINANSLIRPLRAHPVLDTFPTLGNENFDTAAAGKFAVKFPRVFPTVQGINVDVVLTLRKV